MSSPFQKKFSAKSPMGSTPLTKKSPFYVADDKKSGFQPNRATVELNNTTRLTRDGSVVRDRKSGEVVVGGAEDSSGRFVPKTAEQKAFDWDQDPRNVKGSETKKRLKTRQEKEFNKPENVAKRKTNQAKMDAQSAAAKAKKDAAKAKKDAAKKVTKTEALTKTRDTRSNKERKQAAVDTKKAQSAKDKAEILSKRAERKKIKDSKNT
jgi:ABC-type proline/glycine betaine transport system ATPase subunit